MSVQSTIRSSDQERTPLSRHYFQCADASGPFHELACMLEDLHAFGAQRRVTTLIVALLIVAAVVAVVGALS